MNLFRKKIARLPFRLIAESMYNHREQWVENMNYFSRMGVTVYSNGSGFTKVTFPTVLEPSKHEESLLIAATSFIREQAIKDAIEKPFEPRHEK